MDIDPLSDFKKVEKKVKRRGKYKRRQKPKIYGCDEYGCGKQFTLKHNMLSHINQVHLKLKYDCNQCDYKAGQKGSLVRHQKARHGNGVRHLKCLQCPKTYK